MQRRSRRRPEMDSDEFQDFYNYPYLPGHFIGNIPGVMDITEVGRTQMTGSTLNRLPAADSAKTIGIVSQERH